MLIADVLRAKGHEVVRIAPEEKVIAAVQRLSERRIGATVVENAWMRVVGTARRCWTRPWASS